jgi:integrase/recombinase XerD
VKTAELVQLFLERRLSRSPITLHNSLVMLQGFITFAPEEAGAIVEAHLSRYRLALSQLPIDPGTAYSRFLLVRQFLRWACTEEHILIDPGASFREKRPRRNQRFVPTRAQMEALLHQRLPPGYRCGPPDRDWLGDRDRITWELAYGTGLRRAELARLNLQDYERNPPGLWVRQGKGKKDRQVPVGDRLAKRLEHYLRKIRPALRPLPEERAFLIDREGGRFNSHAIAARFRLYADLLELPKFSLHGLRHAFATHLLEGGATLQEVGLLLGHSNLEATERYTQILPLELLREYRRTHPRARRRRTSQ